MSRAELSRRCKVSDAAITGLLDPAGATSKLVPLVHKALSWPPPAMLPVWADQQRGNLEAVWGDLTEDDKRLLVDTAIKIALRNK